MSHPNVSQFSPDKLVKDLQWDAITEASEFAHGKLLDVGCGEKPYKSILAWKVTKYVGIDKHGSTVDIKKDFLTAAVLDKSYDTILCTQVLEHTPEPQKFLNKIYRILRKDGVLILTVPFTGSLHEEPHDYFRFTKYGLAYLLEKAGFKIVYIKAKGNWISAIAQDKIFYMESTFNRFLLKYPKRIIQFCIQISARVLSHLPDRCTKPEKSHINYIAVAKKL